MFVVVTKKSVMLKLLTMSSCFVFYSSRRRHTRYWRDWSSDVCSSDLHPRVLVDDRYVRQVVALAHRVVGGVVRGRHLHRARAELGVYELVGDDGNLAVDDGEYQRPADKVGVTLVLRADGDGRVAEHRLGARRRHRQAAAGALDGVLQVVELPGLRLLLDLQVREGRLVFRAPVDHAGAAVDEPLLVAADEELADGAREVLVHRELLARPVHARALAPHLPLNLAAVLLLPLPHAADELLAPD